MTDCKEKALFDIFLAANVFAKVRQKKEEEAKDAARYFERVLYSLGPLESRIESSDHISLLDSTKNTDPSGVFLKKAFTSICDKKKSLARSSLGLLLLWQECGMWARDMDHKDVLAIRKGSLILLNLSLDYLGEEGKL